jgi:short-subunit dehydrogenase
MSKHLKPLEDQVIVLTGASSGIGLVTARMAAKRGARMVLAARSEDALRDLAEEINNDGGEALAVACDVSNREDMQRLHDVAVERFGGYDTWINDAGVGMYGKILDVPHEDARKLFDTNVFGVLHGSQIATKHFKDRDDQRFDGCLINVGSVLSYQPIPLQGIYVASKHAVKGLTDSLRQEVLADDLPVSVTLIMPNAIDTPYAEHAANYMGVEADVPPPTYAPETVARAILHATTTPTRDLTVGGAFKPMSMLNNVFPGVVDSVMAAFLPDAQRREERYIAPDDPRALTNASSKTSRGGLHERSGQERLTMPVSAYTQARMHPLASAAVLAGAGLLLSAAYHAVTED